MGQGRAGYTCTQSQGSPERVTIRTEGCLKCKRLSAARTGRTKWDGAMGRRKGESPVLRPCLKSARRRASTRRRKVEKERGKERERASSNNTAAHFSARLGERGWVRGVCVCMCIRIYTLGGGRGYGGTKWGFLSFCQTINKSLCALGFSRHPPAPSASNPFLSLFLSHPPPTHAHTPAHVYVTKWLEFSSVRALILCSRSEIFAGVFPPMSLPFWVSLSEGSRAKSIRQTSFPSARLISAPRRKDYI